MTTYLDLSDVVTLLEDIIEEHGPDAYGRVVYSPTFDQCVYFNGAGRAVCGVGLLLEEVGVTPFLDNFPIKYVDHHREYVDVLFTTDALDFLTRFQDLQDVQRGPLDEGGGNTMAEALALTKAEWELT